MTRTVFLLVFFLLGFGPGLLGAAEPAGRPAPKLQRQAAVVLRRHVLRQAAWALQQPPLTVTSAHSPRSAGGLHDFFSEGDYWWPDPQNPAGPYVQRDGLTNPDNFVAHRQAMIRFSRIIGALASAYRLTGDEQYATPGFTCKPGFWTRPRS
jgi:hypothetical protein